VCNPAVDVEEVGTNDDCFSMFVVMSFYFMSIFCQYSTLYNTSIFIIVCHSAYLYL